MEQKQSFDLRFSTGMTRSQSNEHLRNFTERAFEEKRTRNFDPSREHLNFEVKRLENGMLSIIPLNKNYAIDKRIKDNLDSRGIKDPNEELDKDNPNRRTTVLDIIFSGSRERMRELAFGNQKIEEDVFEKKADNSGVKRMMDIEEWAKDMYDFAAEKFGEKNIAAFVVHLDEKNPHIHCTVLPVGIIKGKERISSKSIFGDKYKSSAVMKSLHDDLAVVNEKWGLNRGDDIYQTGARHRTTEEYWRDLTNECTGLENKSDKLKKENDSLASEIAKKRKAVKGLQTMIDNLTREYEDLEQLLANMEPESEKAQAIREELDRLEKVLQDKKEKLDKVTRELEELTAKTQMAKDDLIQTKKEYLYKNSEIATLVGWQVACQELEKTQKSLKEFRDDLSYTQKTQFDSLLDDSIIDDMAERSQEIVTVAAALFVGYVDTATTFASMHGGGGGGSNDLPKRKNDEDDWNWMMRCFNHARKMMKPTGRQVKR